MRQAEVEELKVQKFKRKPGTICGRLAHSLTANSSQPEYSIFNIRRDGKWSG